MTEDFTSARRDRLLRQSASASSADDERREAERQAQLVTLRVIQANTLKFPELHERNAI
jgi:hypothetical protein